MDLSIASITCLQLQPFQQQGSVLVQTLTQEMLAGDNFSTGHFLAKLVFRDSSLLICDKKRLYFLNA